jgi:hypothetical protein
VFRRPEKACEVVSLGRDTPRSGECLSPVSAWCAAIVVARLIAAATSLCRQRRGRSERRNSSCDDLVVLDRVIDWWLDGFYWITEQTRRYGTIIGPIVSVVGVSVVFITRDGDFNDFGTIVTVVGIVLAGLAIAGWGPFERKRQPPATKTCPDCAEEVKAEAKVCRFAVSALIRPESGVGESPQSPQTSRDSTARPCGPMDGNRALKPHPATSGHPPPPA